MQILSEESFIHHQTYIDENPVKAGLEQNKSCRTPPGLNGPYSTAALGCAEDTPSLVLL